MTSSDAPEIHTYIEISLEHLKFQAVLHGPWPRRHCNCVGSKFCNKKIRTSFLYPQSWISHFGLYNYHRVQWRGSKTAGKECSELCHGLIPSLWDFAQTYSLQIERRDQTSWRGPFYSPDSEKAIELSRAFRHSRIA